MKILITGICGFVGSALACALRDAFDSTQLQIIGIDNLSRPGSEINRRGLRSIGAEFLHADLRMPSDIEAVGDVDWVIDAAANPSVLAGVGGRGTSRQLVEHNLIGTVNILEYCKARKCGLILLSTSRVYSVPALASVRVEIADDAFRPLAGADQPEGLTADGITEQFSTAPPVSLYGATKLASEQLSLEYGESFGFDVWINRCGVLAGAGQFGHAEQGIFSYWIQSWVQNAPLRYIGFDGQGRQVRDCLHPRDLVPLLHKQMTVADRRRERIVNLGGGTANSLSLSRLSEWCAERFGPRKVMSDTTARPFDAPWIVMNARLAEELWDWRVQTPVAAVLDEIAAHAESHPQWLDLVH